MTTTVQKTVEFMLRHGIYVGHNAEMPSHKLRLDRARVVTEEAAELVAALQEGDLVKALDAVGDLIFAARVTAFTMGVNPEPIEYLVAESNLTKTKLNEHAKGGKGAGYVSPEEKIETHLGIVHGWTRSS